MGDASGPGTRLERLDRSAQYAEQGYGRVCQCEYPGTNDESPEHPQEDWNDQQIKCR
jgi:hypothetical protein